MANYAVKPDSQYTITMGGKSIVVNRKVIPDSLRATKNVASYVKRGQPMKPCAKMRTGRVLGITIHNTEDIRKLLSGIQTAAEQYVLATYNGNMGGAVVHYYVSPGVVWQLLEDDEQGWHSGTGSATKTGNKGITIGGNVDTIAIEVIGSSKAAEETAAILTAYLLNRHKLEVNDIYSHYFWSGKNCPIYILPHWDLFKSTVKGFLDTVPKSTTGTTPAATSFAVDDVVTVKPDSVWTTGKAVANFVYGMKMYVTKVNANGTVVISTSKGGPTTGAIAADRLVKVSPVLTPIPTPATPSTPNIVLPTTPAKKTPKVIDLNSNLKIIIPNTLRIVYWDKEKKSANFENFISGGFFAYYSETVNGKKVNFTLPVANLMCDFDSDTVGKKYLLEWTKNKGISNGKLTMTVDQNGSKQFAGKKVATFIVGANQAYVSNTDIIPNTSKYAISGVPVIINNSITDWTKGVVPQGWTAGNIYATYRNWIGIMKGEPVIVCGKTTTSNYILSKEVAPKLKEQGISDLVALDGGGSYILKLGNTVSATAENRQINNIIVFD